MKNFCENVQAVFHIADKYTKTHLPFQIFVNREFKFLITSGGAFVEIFECIKYYRGRVYMFA